MIPKKGTVKALTNPKMLREDMGRHVMNSIEQCFRKLNPAIRSINPDDLRLFIPEVYMPYLFEYLHSMSMRNFIYREDFRYNGIKAIPGYENKIVICYKEAAIRNDVKMISTVDL